MSTDGGEEKKSGPPPAAEKKQPLTKAERRALQEKQRAAKAAARGEVPAAAAVAAKGETPKKKALAPQQQSSSSAKSEKIGCHLSEFRRLSLVDGKCPSAKSALRQDAHPAIVALGLQFAAGTVDGSNRRCVAMLMALKRALSDYSCPVDAAVGRDLDKKLKAMVQYLVDCRPHAVSMGAAVKHLRGVVSRFGPETTETEAKRLFSEAVDTYVRERIVLPGSLIGDHGAKKIRNGDVVATYLSGGDAVEAVFRKAVGQGIQFKVVIIDARPHYKGRRLLSLLHTLGVATTYVHLRAVNFALKDASTLFLGGCEAVYSNGAVLADAGTAAVAMTAMHHNVPVLVCAESYKFNGSGSTLRWLDALAWNEKADPDAIFHQKNKKVDCLHLRFDLTPPKFITAVITEHGLIPPTSSAVLVRELELGAAQAPPEQA